MQLPDLGTVFQSKYRLDQVLGEGGFARVYQAQDVGAERVVAVKVLKPHDDGYSSDMQSRFNREVKVVANLRDPHTVTMFDFGRTADGLLYMVFEYVPGTDLSHVLAERGPLGDQATTHILTQVLHSLREAHQAGLLHRDIKPENIRIYEYMGDPLRVMLLDFGIAKPVTANAQAEAAITHSGSLVGTPQYMSPEQLLEKPLTAASDIYSLGLVAYEMLTGSPAIRGNQLSDQLHVLASASGVMLPADVPVGAPLRRIVDRMISKDSVRRMQTAEQVLRALESMHVPEQGDISLDETGAIVAPGSQPLQPPGSQPLRSPGSQPLQPPGSQPLQPPGSQPLHAPGTGPGDGRPISRPIVPPDPIPTSRSKPIPIRGRGPATTQPGRALPEAKAESEISTQTLVLAMLVVLVCLVFGLIAVKKIVKGNETEQTRPPAPVLTVAPPSPTPPRPDEPTEPPPAPKETAPSEGCGAPAPFEGFGLLRVTDGLTQRRTAAYIPNGYQAKHHYPLVVLFHDVQQTPREILRDTKLDKLAEREDFVVLMPADDELPAWHDASDVARSILSTDDAMKRLCIDPARVFLLGHGAGGRMAERVPCESTLFAGMATTAYRPMPGVKGCRPIESIPHIHFAPLKDRNSPPDGSPGCLGEPTIPVDSQEALRRRINHCGKERREYLRFKGSVCYSWDCPPESPFVSCRVDGGRGWPGTDERAWDVGKCDGRPADFPYGKTIWEFFEKSTAGAEKPEEK